MEPRSRETTPLQEDLDFIVDDGYNHDDDPTYVPDDLLSDDSSNDDSSNDDSSNEKLKRTKEFGFKLPDLDEMLKPGFSIEKIIIDDFFIKSYSSKYIALKFIDYILKDGDLIKNDGEYFFMYLPLPFTFCKKWLSKYKKMNFRHYKHC